MRALIALALLALAVIPARAADALVIKESKHSVKMTLNRLEKLLLSKGIKIMGRIDHAAGAKAAGLKMPETELLLFGNPKLGTPLMLANPQIAAALPMKVLVWTAKSGKVFIGYEDPATLKQRFNITDHDEIFAKMSKALEAFTTAAAAQ
ncbi:MAG: DUF302 domain-containing protein [Hyphomicrobiaceae bacterium]|nr:DUF302 domain-containing protein [Hyphomicrobiaceae bacterium]